MNDRLRVPLSPAAIRRVFLDAGWRPESNARPRWMAFTTRTPAQAYAALRAIVFYQRPLGAMRGCLPEWQCSIGWQGPGGPQAVTQGDRIFESLAELREVLTTYGPGVHRYERGRAFDHERSREAVS